MDVVTTVLRVLASEPAPDVLDQACRRAAGLLGADGLSVTVLRPGQHRYVVAASSEAVVSALDDEVVVGGGPVHDAHRGGAPVAVQDVLAEEPGRWPLLAVHSSRRCPQGRYRSTLAVPVPAAGGPFAVVALASRAPSALAQVPVAALETVGRAIVLAEPRTLPVLDLDEAGGHAREPTPLGRWARHCLVSQATGMVCVQARTSPGPAYDLLRAAAFAAGRSLDGVVRDVVERRLTLSA